MSRGPASRPHALILLVALLVLGAGAAAGPPADIEADVARRLLEAGAPVKVWIHLTDKGHAGPAESRAAVLALADGVASRQIARRAARRTLPGLFDARDLPVAPAYLAQLAERGIATRHASRWLNAVSAYVDAADLAALAELPFVARVSLVARSVGPAPNVRPVVPDASPGAYAGSGFYGLAFDQLQFMNLPALHGQGFTGDGVVIGVLDTGFATTHDAFNDPANPLDVIASWDFVDDDADVGPEPSDDPDQHFHGTIVLGAMAAYLPDELVGAAYDASYILAKTEDTTQEVQAEEDSYVAGLEFAELNGADVVTSSLGYIDWYTQADLDGQTAVTTVAVNLATANGVVCLTAPGNDGNDLDPATSTLIAPSDAFDVITVGSCAITGEPSFTSSSGPTADGRVKPEVIAVGEDVASVWPYDDAQFSSASGTSMSTPLMAGLVACLLEAGPTWTPATVRERLIKTADFFGEPAPDPFFTWGWGFTDAVAALNLAGTWTDLGGAVAGSNGTPSLTGAGPLVADELWTLTLGDGLPFGSAFFVLGVSALNAPFKGGLLVPSPDVLIPGIPLDAAGAVVIGAPWPAEVPSGVSLWYQYWIPDAGAIVNFAASNGVQGTTP